MSSFLTPPDRVQVRAVGLHPIVVLWTPAIKMDLCGRGIRTWGVIWVHLEHRSSVQTFVDGDTSCTLSLWSSVSTIVATRISIGFLLSTASTFIPIWKPCGCRCKQTKTGTTQQKNKPTGTKRTSCPGNMEIAKIVMFNMNGPLYCVTSMKFSLALKIANLLLQQKQKQARGFAFHTSKDNTGLFLVGCWEHLLAWLILWGRAF